MDYISKTITIPASTYDNKRIETIPVILPDADANDSSVRKVTVVRTSSWMLTEEELAACRIELTQYQIACLIEILYKVTEAPIIFYLDSSGQPVLEIYDDYRE
jgi:hypothetical protein